MERTFYCRGQTGQQLLLGAYQPLQKEIDQGRVILHSRSEMLDLVTIDGRARGIVYRDMVSGEIRSIAGEAVVLASGGYGAAYFNSTNAINRTERRSGVPIAEEPRSQIRPSCRSTPRASRSPAITRAN